MNTSKAVAVTIKRPFPAPVPATLAETAIAEVLEQREDEADGLARVDPEFRHQMIASAAYFIAEQRGFAPGHELGDWCAADCLLYTSDAADE